MPRPPIFSNDLSGWCCLATVVPTVARAPAIQPVGASRHTRTENYSGSHRHGPLMRSWPSSELTPPPRPPSPKHTGGSGAGGGTGTAPRQHGEGDTGAVCRCHGAAFHVEGYPYLFATCGDYPQARVILTLGWVVRATVRA